jgi:hypothetical protein
VSKCRIGVANKCKQRREAAGAGKQAIGVGLQYGNHSVRLGSDGAEKACGSKGVERHHETLIASRDRRVLASTRARLDEMETGNAGRQEGG